jgi:hypothetical protein
VGEKREKSESIEELEVIAKRRSFDGASKGGRKRSTRLERRKSRTRASIVVFILFTAFTCEKWERRVEGVVDYVIVLERKNKKGFLRNGAPWIWR